MILLAADDSVIAKNAAAEQWLDELNVGEGDALPIEVNALAAQLRRVNPSLSVPQLLVRTRARRWAILQASWMPHQGRDAIAIIIQQAPADQVAPIVMRAYGLTGQERTVSGLVFQGVSTHAISEQLHITQNTVQDQLKSIFEKTGVRTRRELITTVLREQYLPHAEASHAPSLARQGTAG